MPQNRLPSLHNTLPQLSQKVWLSARLRKMMKGKSMQVMMKMQNAPHVSKLKHRLKVAVVAVVAVVVPVADKARVVEAVNAVARQLVAAVDQAVPGDKYAI